ncbi:MAG: hypothetical protein IJ620_02820 [Bacteroidales bacterium]|nr:hypothetical protein [Bacteroidales bacterium]
MDNPLAEVFGFPIENESKKAIYYRENRLCPFYNRYPNCTKHKTDNPLGVCSINHNGDAIITCPSRFREDWIILKHAADFILKDGTRWTALPEIKLNDGNGSSAGNIDYVIVCYDKDGNIIDFASLEVQGVYISGNLRNPFRKYIDSPTVNFKWMGRNYPHPDYLSSSRKRLMPQILYKGGIFKSWGKKQCVAIQKTFFETLPQLPKTTKDRADIAWFLYDLVFDEPTKMYRLQLTDTVYTEFNAALSSIMYTIPGNVNDFMNILQTKLDEKLTNTPDTHSVFEII